MPVVVERAEGRSLAALRWGIQPYWMQPGRAPPPINARAETLAPTGLFKRALSERRCVMPATGFFEWQTNEGEKRKAPHHLGLRGGVFGLAGPYAPPDGERPGTY